MATTEELLPLALDQSKDYALILIDTAGVVVGWLAGAEYVLGYAADEVVGRHFDLIFTPRTEDAGCPLTR